MPTLSVKTIKPAGGGNYSSLNAWDLAERANLVTNDRIAQAECYSGGNLLTSNLSLSAATWVTDATRYIDIFAAPGEQHAGIWTTTKAWMRQSSTSSPTLICTGRYIRLRNLQIEQVSANHGQGTIRCDGTAGDVLLDRCIVRMSVTAGASSTGTVFVNQSGGSVRFQNCFIINYGGATNGHVYAIWVTAKTVTVYNCTLIGLNVLGSGKTSGGIIRDSATNSITEDVNYMHGTNTMRADAGSITKGNFTATSDTGANTVGLRSIGYTTTEFIDVTSGAEDLDLQVTGGHLKFQGQTISGVTEDIAGRTRPAAPSIGAFDVANFTYNVTCADGASMADQGTKVADVIVTCVDGIQNSDSAAQVSVFPVSCSDGLVTADESSGSRAVSVDCDDGIAGSDSADRKSKAFVDLDDPRFGARPWAYRRKDA